MKENQEKAMSKSLLYVVVFFRLLINPYGLIYAVLGPLPTIVFTLSDSYMPDRAPRLIFSLFITVIGAMVVHAITVRAIKHSQKN